LLAVFSAREQNQVLKEVEVENALDDLYYDAFSGQCHFHRSFNENITRFCRNKALMLSLPKFCSV